MSSVTRVLNALRTGPKTNKELSQTGDMFRRNTWTYTLVREPGNWQFSGEGGVACQR